MREGLSLLDGDGVRHTLATVEYDACGAPTRLQSQNRLNHDLERLHLEILEHYGGYFLPIGFGVERAFGVEHILLVRGQS